MLYELYPKALDLGMNTERFWNCSLQEITDYLESGARQERQNMKNSMVIAHAQAHWVGEFVSLVLNGGENRIKGPIEKYPELFTEEAEEYQKQKQREELEAFKERRRRHIAEINRRRTPE